MKTIASILTALCVSACTFGVSQAPGEDKPTVNISGEVTLQDFKAIKKLLGGVAVPVPVTPWAFFQM